MNTLKVTIPLVEVLKLVPNLPPCKVETVSKWEENAVLVVSSGEVNHNLPNPVPFEEWLAEQKPGQKPEPTSEPEPAKKKTKNVAQS